MFSAIFWFWVICQIIIINKECLDKLEDKEKK